MKKIKKKTTMQLTLDDVNLAKEVNMLVLDIHKNMDVDDYIRFESASGTPYSFEYSFGDMMLVGQFLTLLKDNGRLFIEFEDKEKKK